MQSLHQPKELKLEGDLATNWRKWKANFHTYLIASGCDGKSEEVRAALFLHCVGEDTRDILSTLVDEEEQKSPQSIEEALDNYFIPKTNMVVVRHKFNVRTQQPHEPFSSFLNDLRKLSMDCDYGTLRDSLIKDRIVCGIRDTKTKDRLLREADLDLEKAINICKAAEQTDQHFKQLYNSETNVQVGEIRNVRQHDGRKKTVNESRGSASRAGARNAQGQATSTADQGHGRQQNPAQGNKTFNCTKCGTTHEIRACPAYGRQCNKCKRYNHFAKCCTLNTRHVNVVETNTAELENSNDYLLGALELATVNSDWMHELFLKNCNTTLNFKLDTGAQVNVLPKHVFDKLQLSDVLYQTTAKVRNFEGTKLQVIGACKLNVLCNNREHEVEFIVIKTLNNATPVLGLETIQKFELIQRTIATVNQLTNNLEGILHRFSKVFHGVGDINIPPINLELKEDYTPSVKPCRKVPYRLLEPLKKELTRMEEAGIITKMEQPTEFVNPMLLVKKPNGQLRLCLDPRDLNAALLREHYALPTFEEISHDLAGSKVFTVLDANKGFWQIRLNDKSAKLCTFATPFGRFSFRRLPFGLTCAPEIFHRTFSKIFEGIDGCKTYIDDLLIYAKNELEHNKILEQVLKRADQYGVVFNREKCQFKLSEIKYLGHKFTNDGIKIDKDKIEAINKIPPPCDRKELARFLGMITYVSKFIPNMSSETYHLRQLLRKETLWSWNENHTREFTNLKHLLSNTPVLHYYDVDADITLSVDSSKTGMGAVILQNNRPVAYASKSLTSTQESYAQIEKEALAIAFGIKRFHQYLYGRKFRVESDHKPLEQIFKKPLDKIPLRLQRISIMLQPYEFDVVYKPGKLLYLADALSRASYVDNFQFPEQDIDIQLDLIDLEHISPQKYTSIKDETAKDLTLRRLQEVIKQGWPTERKQLAEDVKPFWKCRDSLVVINDILYKNNQIVVPKSLREDMIERLHYPHLGMTKTIAKAQELLYWPHMTKEIMDRIRNCEVCLRHSNSQQNEDFFEKEIPTRSFETVAADLFEHQGQHFLLLVDVYSKFPELEFLFNNTTSTRLIQSLKANFSRYGKPDTLFTDNGSNLVSTEVETFLQEWEITHKTNSPRYSQSNGFIERHVQTIKKLIIKALDDNKDVYKALLEYRNTPLQPHLPSPAQLLQGRRIKGIIPVKEELLLPTGYDYTNYQKALRRSYDKQKLYYNRDTTNLPELQKGDGVMIQNHATKLWEPGIIIKKDDHRPRSYVVKLDSKNINLIRNRKFLKPYIKTNHNIEDKEYEETFKRFLIPMQNHTPSNDTNQKPLNESLINQSLDNSPIRNGSVLHSNPSSKINKEPEDSSNFTNSNNIRQTRSGRVIKKPVYLSDYSL